MTAVNRGIVLVLAGLLALQMSLTDDMLSFLRPTMRPWLIIAGVTLVVLGASTLVGSRREIGGHGHNVRVGWLLILPLCAGILAPRALDSRAAQRAAAWRGQLGPSRPFDLDAYLRAHAVGGGVPRLEIVEYLSAVDSHRAYLEAHSIRLVGFVTPSPVGGNRFNLTRFLVGCCAADAIPLQVDVTAPGAAPPADTWVEVAVRLDPDRLGPDRDDTDPPLAHALALHKVARPSEPYEYPG